MNKHVVLQTDFGLSDGAVSAMYGVALSVDPTLSLSDLTHDIPEYNIWEASYRLYQTIPYWPVGTVFISVVDPGVGSDRLSIVAKTKEGHFIVTPNNGTLTHISHHIGIESVRIIDEDVNRLPRSGESYTFHGRDVYAYTGARLASGVISFEEVGEEICLDQIVHQDVQQAISDGTTIVGSIDILDVRFGNLWTNIPRNLCVEAGMDYGDVFEVTIKRNNREVYNHHMTFGRSFAESQLGESLLYVNSVDHIGVAMNQGSFAQAYHIGTGSNWKITIKKG